MFFHNAYFLTFRFLKNTSPKYVRTIFAYHGIQFIEISPIHTPTNINLINNTDTSTRERRKSASHRFFLTNTRKTARTASNPRNLLSHSTRIISIRHHQLRHRHGAAADEFFRVYLDLQPTHARTHIDEFIIGGGGMDVGRIALLHA